MIQDGKSEHFISPDTAIGQEVDTRPEPSQSVFTEIFLLKQSEITSCYGGSWKGMKLWFLVVIFLHYTKLTYLKGLKNE